jgi:hypothetical protein
MAESVAGIDLSGVLADLQEKRAFLKVALDSLDTAIEALASFGGISAPGPGAAKKAGGPNVVIKADTFFRMNVLEAVKKYLRMSPGDPRTINQITDALNKGGLQCKPDSVATIMSKAVKTRDVEKVGGGNWGLPEWYHDRKENGGAEDVEG